MAEWLTNQDPWPKHKRPATEGALEDARAEGWLFLEGGHWGKIKCPHGSPEHDQCSFVVFGTGEGDKGGGVAAKGIREKLRRCKKRRESDAEGVNNDAVDIDRELRDLEQLVFSLARLRLSERLRARSELKLQNALETEDDDAGAADQLLQDADVDDQLAVEEANAARAYAYKFGLGGDPWPPLDGANALLPDIRKSIERIEQALTITPKPAAKSKLLELKAQLDE